MLMIVILTIFSTSNIVSFSNPLKQIMMGTLSWAERDLKTTQNYDFDRYLHILVKWYNKKQGLI